MSNVILSTSRSKQPNLALHSRRFRSYPSTSSRTWRACSLLAVSPYGNRPFDSRAKGVAEAVTACAGALSDLNQLANEPYMAYLKCKLGELEWYSEAPRPASKQPAVDADEPAPAAGDQEEATEADAPSGRGDGRGFVLD
jgi:hypothetical protein